MSASSYFEWLGFKLGVGLGKARAAARVAARPPAPKVQPAPAPAAAKTRKRTGPLNVGDQVVYRQGRGKFTGLIVRRALDGRFVVTRDRDGKRVLRPADLLTRAP